MTAGSISAVAALDDPLRRRLYDAVAASSDGLTRDTAARAAGVARHVAAYHLDRLAECGLLTVEHRRQTGRTGPGAGRPAKVYRHNAGAPIEVTVPRRNYRLASQLLLQAIPQAGTRDLAAASAQRGAAIGRAARDRRGRAAGVGSLVAVLDGLGFEPKRTRSGEVRLRNCPFHELAETDRETVCGMNLALLRGLAGGMDLHGVEAVLDTEPGGCCVAFRVTRRAG